jgi:hypothetical protein
MADNINSCDDDEYVPLPIDEIRLKEMKAMEAAEQSLIEDLFNTCEKDKAPTFTKPLSQNKPTVLNKKAMKKPKS